jgi:hypothetical protein
MSQERLTVVEVQGSTSSDGAFIAIRAGEAIDGPSPSMIGLDRKLDN